MTIRRDLEATWKFLEEQGYQPPRRDGRPFVPSAMPMPSDEELGFDFFRTQAVDESFAHLTLPRTFFGRSLLERVDFTGSDLHESWFCWNDFVACNFSGADLRDCDFRAAVFKNCSFTGADLRGAELRSATFDDCFFEGARLEGAHMLRPFSLVCGFSETQRAQLTIEEFHAEEPPGG